MSEYPYLDTDWIGEQQCRCCEKKSPLPMVCFGDYMDYVCRACLVAALALVDGSTKE